VALGAGRVDRSAALDRRPAPGLRRVGWVDPHLAVRPDGHGLPPGQRPDHAGFAAVAKHYGVSVANCPPRRGNRKGVVEKANHTAAQRWWRTLADDVSVEQAQASLDRWCLLRGDTRMRPTTDGKSTVATVAGAEPFAPLPGPFPAVLAVQRVASA